MLYILIVIVISFIISAISLKVKFLTFGGCIAQFVLAVLILGLGGIKWTVPIVTFFFLSSILSKIRSRKNKDVEKYFEKPGRRDQWQVIANGGIGGVLVVINYFFYSELLYLIYVSSLAAVCADTWATEIGTLKKARTFNILNFEPVEQGVSGGISAIGTMGSVLGAFIIPVSSVSFISGNYFYSVLMVAISGILGSLTDSLLGASIQAQYLCIICGKITEHKIHCDKTATINKGFRWINNDVVNFISACAGGIFIVFFKICL
jgi:uncharacterized protein (TIGR00297 family)